MKTSKKIDLGEYIVVIEYDSIFGTLDVTILDEAEGVIDSINITNDEEDNNEPPINPSLN
jgi:hypothetical protein